MSITNWGQKWKFSQMYKWYRSWWIDLTFNRELSVIHSHIGLNRPNLKKKKKLSVWETRNKWYRYWWIDLGFVQGLLVIRLCTEWIDPQIQHINLHPTKKRLRQKLTKNHKKQTNKLSKNWKLIHQSWETLGWRTYLPINELVLNHIDQTWYQ